MRLEHFLKRSGSEGRVNENIQYDMSARMIFKIEQMDHGGRGEKIATLFLPKCMVTVGRKSLRVTETKKRREIRGQSGSRMSGSVFLSFSDATYRILGAEKTVFEWGRFFHSSLFTRRKN